jgi:hypothetical protein
MNTNRGEAHLLDIIQLLDNPLPCAAAVFVDITRSSGRTISPCEAIGKDLIDRLTSPLCWGQALHQSGEVEETEQQSKQVVGYHNLELQWPKIAKPSIKLLGRWLAWLWSYIVIHNRGTLTLQVDSSRSCLEE